MLEHGDTVLAPYPDGHCLWPAILAVHAEEDEWQRADGCVWCKFMESSLKAWVPNRKVIPFDSLNARLARPEPGAHPNYDEALKRALKRVETRANAAKRKHEAVSETPLQSAFVDFGELSDEPEAPASELKLEQPVRKRPRKEEQGEDNPDSIDGAVNDELQHGGSTNVERTESINQSEHTRSTSIASNPQLDECFAEIAALRSSARATTHSRIAADSARVVRKPKKLTQIRLRADAKNDMKDMREFVRARDLNATVAAQERDMRNARFVNGIGGNVDAAQDDGDFELCSGMVALASASGHPHWPCIVDRVLRPNDVSVPLEDAAVCWVYYLNGYKADLAKTRDIIPYTLANVKMVKRKVARLSKKKHRELDTLPGAFDEAEDRILKASSFSPPNDAVSSDGPLTLGTVVLARMDAYPPWPAVISRCNDGKEKQLLGEWKAFLDGDQKVFCAFLDGNTNWVELSCVWKLTKARANCVPVRRSNKFYSIFVASCKKAEELIYCQSSIRL